MDIITKTFHYVRKMADTPLVLGKKQQKVFENILKKYDGNEDVCAIVKWHES